MVYRWLTRIALGGLIVAMMVLDVTGMAAAVYAQNLVIAAASDLNFAFKEIVTVN